MSNTVADKGNIFVRTTTNKYTGKTKVEMKKQTDKESKTNENGTPMTFAEKVSNALVKEYKQQ